MRPRGILVVDDNADIRAVLRAGLGHAGFAVWLAGDGREAVEVYRAHRPSVDLVLLDVRMPGWDGPDTLAALRESDPDVRICFMTGDAGRYTETDLLGLGALAVFRKPFRLGELADRLDQLMASPVEPYEDLQAGRWCDGGPDNRAGA